MQTNRKRVARAWKGTGLTDGQKEHLAHGSTLFCGYEIPEGTTADFPFHSEEERKSLWFEHREEIMAWVFADRKKTIFNLTPGTRPLAWWDYESTEPRKMVKKAEVEKYVPNKKLYMGIPAGFSFERKSFDDFGKLPEYETQFNYLKRLNLLVSFKRFGMRFS